MQGCTIAGQCTAAGTAVTIPNVGPTGSSCEESAFRGARRLAARDHSRETSCAGLSQKNMSNLRQELVFETHQVPASNCTLSLRG
jgi:hypothetical protein